MNFIHSNASLHCFILLVSVVGSVADPGCLSLIPDPDFYPSLIPDLGFRIPDPKTAMKHKGEKNLFLPFFGAINFTKLNYFIFEMLKKKIWANFQRIIELFIQKLSLSSQNYGLGIQDPVKT